jgi:ADP-heptose:LPS heptosyltransferase
MRINNIEIKNDCRHFRGHIPCKPHKLYGIKCSDCNYYDKIKEKIIIIKIGAIGDVIRTTTILHKLWEEYPNAEIWWLTDTPDVIPEKVDYALKYNFKNLQLLRFIDFDILINLDKDTEVCSIASEVKAKVKHGFVLKNGKPAAADELAGNKFLTGIFDDINKKNKKSYPEEIYEMLGYKYNKEEYILDFDDLDWNIDNIGKKIIGLNTGCGARWISRLWSEQNWIELSKKLIDVGYFPLLLGGEQEHLKNQMISKESGAVYLGHFPLKNFISLVNQCDTVVTAVTMAMHIAIAQKKQLVLFNNIFNPKEFELFGRGEIVQPDKECKCFFAQKCTNDEYFCMEHLTVSKVFDAIVRNTK